MTMNYLKNFCLNLPREFKEWEPQNDEYYYGEIPDVINADSIKIIFINGLIKYIEECKTFYESQGYIIDIHDESFKDMLDNVLDMWLEHDSKFDELYDEDSGNILDENGDELDEDDEEEYYDNIINSAINYFDDNNNEIVLK